MLNIAQKERIRNISIYEYTSIEKNGAPVGFNGKTFYVPSFLKIREEIFKKILEQGFSKVEHVKPTNANCIIRIFKLQHYTYSESTYNIYGAQCFTLKSGKWIAIGKGGEFELDYSKCTVRHWLCQDEYIEFNLDFFDCYVKVS